jgi:uncharacterized protein
MSRSTTPPPPPPPSRSPRGPGEQLVDRLRDRLAQQTGRPVGLLETHISWVLLTGDFAYKIKKPVDLGFLDFSTPELRKHFCDEELRLNRRLAPDLYLDVVAIRGTSAAPMFEGDGPVLDHAVRMREFPQDDLLPRVLARGELTAALVEALAIEVAAFHRRVDAAPGDGPYGVPADILHYAVQNFTQVRKLADFPGDAHALSGLESWTSSAYAALRPVLAERRRGGFIRECHGDLHLGNIALVGDRLTIFDCLEFNPELRWIDTMSEAAFLAMDLADRGHPDLSHRFVSAYVEATGDYDGVAVLRFYLVYRAMVRAKVACLRALPLGTGAPRATLLDECLGYVDLARHYAAPSRGAVVITHGLAGSGKSTLAQALVDALGAIRIRADVERKRLHGLAANDRSGSAIGADLYAADATERTYARVAEAAGQVAEARHVAIADAAFLRRAHRDRFRSLAATLGVPYVIVDCTAAESTLRARIDARARRGNDPSEADAAVLDHQLRTQEPLAPDEMPFVLRHDNGSSTGEGPEPAWWSALAARLDDAPASPRVPALPGEFAPPAIGRRP